MHCCVVNKVHRSSRLHSRPRRAVMTVVTAVVTRFAGSRWGSSRDRCLGWVGSAPGPKRESGGWWCAAFSVLAWWQAAGPGRSGTVDAAFRGERLRPRRSRGGKDTQPRADGAPRRFGRRSRPPIPVVPKSIPLSEAHQWLRPKACRTGGWASSAPVGNLTQRNRRERLGCSTCMPSRNNNSGGTALGAMSR